VVARVEAHAVLELDVRGGVPVAPHDAVVAHGERAGQARERGMPVAELFDIERVERIGREIGAARVDVPAYLGTLRRVLRRLRVGDRGAGIDVGRATHAFPVRDRAAGGTAGEI